MEPFVKNLLSSLDLLYYSSGVNPTPQFNSIEAFATQTAKQIKPSCAVIFNGHPLISAQGGDSRLEFQKKWLTCPLTNHSLGSYDCHLMPGTGLYSVIVSGKVRFDESGTSKLGETADIANGPEPQKPKVLWGPWFGFNLTMIVDEVLANNGGNDTINSFDYRLTFKPHDSVIRI